ncbi:MAG: hypothetical protein IPI66_08960 [Chitinophagaceae bacterium]|nr:hypothetical protein [Chitinophagaceae bacterium]MBL0057352.1 hypothetical protein [Chitinophagaceae bacterium]
MGLTLMAVFMIGLPGHSQYKTFSLNDEGDTLNAIDYNGIKQGKWVNHIDEIRGEPGYEEEGIYKNDKKEGIWRKYSLTGDIIAVEFYKNGGKDGIQQYYTFLGDLVREESWRGYDPNAQYDTFAVYGQNSDEVIDYKIVKAAQYSVKHGEWRYFEAGSGRLIKSEIWDRGQLMNIPAPAKTVDVVADKPKKVEKTAEMLEWEKKNKGKKKVIRDGKTTL